MRIGVLFQLAAIICLFVFNYSAYDAEKERIQDELQFLRVQKSYENRQSFEAMYGRDWKQEIRNRIVENKSLLLQAWDHYTYRTLVILCLLLISIYHFVRYFYLSYYDVDSELAVLMRYESFTWFISCLWFLILAGCSIYYLNAQIIAAGAYLLSIFSLAFCLYAVSTFIQQKKIRNLNGVRVFEIVLSSLLYFHVIGIVVLWQTMPLLIALSQRK